VKDPEAFEDQTRLYSPCVEHINSSSNVYIWHMTIAACIFFPPTDGSNPDRRTKRKEK